MIKEAEDLDLDDAESLIEGFTRVAEPLSFDPHWNRLWAILWDGPQGDPSVSFEYWEKYVDDLKTVTTYNASERALAQAMVWNHMAELHRDAGGRACRWPTARLACRLFLQPRPAADSAAVKRAQKECSDLPGKEPLARPRLPAHLSDAGGGSSGLGGYRQSRSRRAPAAGEVSG